MNSPLLKQTATITLDGEEVAFTEGETIYKVAERHRKQVPTLCYDPRLEAFGGCRLCIVELEGARNPVASCTTQATPGMVVRTTTDEIEKYRKTLLEMVSSENRELDVDSLRGYASQELTTLVNRYEARTPDDLSAHNQGRAIQTTKIHLSCATTISASPATGASASAPSKKAITQSAS